jgi:hypothetical protein
LNLKNKIKYSIAALNRKIWPLPEREPSGKFLHIKGCNIVLIFNFSLENDQISLAEQISSIKEKLGDCSKITICNYSDLITLSENDEVKSIAVNDFEISGKPKQNLNTWLRNSNFDILISFVIKENIYCNYLISKIKSAFKAGAYNITNANLFDLTIKQESNNIIEQLELFIQYINQLNINK